MNFSRLALPLLFVAAACLPASPAAADPADALPANLNRPLRELIAWDASQPRTLAAGERRASLHARFADRADAFQTDTDATRAVVTVALDGTQPAAAVQENLAALGAEILAQTPAAISTRLPLASAVAAARLPGVHSLALVRAPHRWVGKVTSQGVAALHVDAVSGTYDGTGITVGVVSDSFDVATNADGSPLADRAADDVASGDLPGPGNPLGHATPVDVLTEGAAGGTDEGRAMLQIVHDVAPGATLAFAAAGATPETMAAAIRNLRTDAGARCDVIVDDVGFDEEPMFSDGVIAQAIDDVTGSAQLAGRPVLYYSAAGDKNGEGSYISDFRLVDNDDARAGTGAGNLQLGQVPGKLTKGGFHNFDPEAGKVNIAQHVVVHGGTASLNFQWDDPWVAGLVSTDYNLLVFDKDGNYLPDLSGTDNNLKLAQAIEIVDLPLKADGSDTAYQLVISRRAGGLQKATHLRYVVTAGGTFTTKKYPTYNAPSIVGHPAAAGADAVAAYDYTDLTHPEDKSSAGPVTIYIDNLGNRLATPQVRQEPTMAAVDGVDTTFFPNAPGADTDNDGFPNFYGTSAAAPHVAGVAALLLQAAGGPGSLTAAQARALLQQSAGPHDLDPGVCTATATSADGTAYTVTVTATGDNSNASSADPRFFRVDFNATRVSALYRLTLDLLPAGEEFDDNPTSGFPFTVGSGSTAAEDGIKVKLGDGDHPYPNRMLLKFKGSGFLPGRVLFFGIDRDLIALHAGGNSADLLAGATLTATVRDAAGAQAVFTGTFANRLGVGYSVVDGFGLINAKTALAGFGTTGQ